VHRDTKKGGGTRLLERDALKENVKSKDEMIPKEVLTY
jgi:hypothetical protein